MNIQNWYQKVFVPRLLNFEMGSEGLEKIRRTVLANISGIVLEVGVGPGYNLPLYKHITKLYALEPSKEHTDIAKNRIGVLTFPVEFLNARAESIPLPNHSIDTVVSTWTLCSVTDPKKVLQEIKRVLKPLGSFVFVEHGASPDFGLRVIQTLSTSVTKYFTSNCHFDRHIEKLIKNAGFDIEGIEHPHEQYKPLIYNYQGTATAGAN